MPRKTLNEVQIPDLDDDLLFKSEQTKLEEKSEKVIDISLEKLVEFPEHPFKVIEDKAMIDLSESITNSGVLVPALVREKDDGTYEIIAGHRRKYASELANKSSMPCIVRNLSDEEATIIMVDTNLSQRENILPSEKAFAYKMRLEATNKQGRRYDLSSAPLEPRLRSNEMLAKEVNESVAQIKRYIRLTELITPLLDMVDNELIALRPAVEISYLSTEQQTHLFDIIQLNDCTPSHAQTIKMHKLDKEGQLSLDKIDEIMSEEKSNQIEKIKIPTNRIKKYFNPKATQQEIEETIVKALDVYQRMLERKKNSRDER